MKNIKPAIFLSFFFIISCSDNPDTENDKESFSVGGVVSDLNGDSLILQNNSADDTIVTENGEYTLQGSYSDHSTYNVTITKQPENPNQICGLTESSGTINSANVDVVDINCTNTYRIGGLLYDLNGRGPIIISNNSTEVIELNAEGQFEFDTEIEDGESYLVVQTDDIQAINCAIIDGTGTVTGAPVTDIRIYCNGVPVSTSPDNSITSFITTIYQPIFRQYCRGCHETGGSGVGRFADINIETAYYDTVIRIDVPNATSLLITKVQSGHGCWPVVGGLTDCTSNAETLSTAINTWISENYQ